jgi:putative transposase
VHRLAGYPPKVAVPALVNSLKGVPARRLRPDFTGPREHFRSPSSFAASCGGAPLNTIRHYIQQQRRSANAASGPTPP